MNRLLVVTALLAAGLLARRRLLVVRVHGNSMLPTYTDGDLLLADRARRARTGAPIVFRTPEPARHDLDGGADPPYRVKRVAAVAGDPTPAWLPGHHAGDRVPPGRIVVRGDAGNSEDSRHYGAVAGSDVLAVVIGRIRKAT